MRLSFRATIYMAAFMLGFQFAANRASAVPPPQDEQTVEAEISSKLRAGKIDDAVDEAKLAADRDPDSAALQQLLGTVLAKKGLNDGARAAFRRAIQIDPSIPQNYYKLAQVNFDENRYDDATRNLEIFLRLNPDNAEAHALLGQTYQNLGDADAAIVQYKRALALTPVLPLIHYRLGSAYKRKGDLKNALEEFTQEIEDTPQFYNAYWQAGYIELGQGNMDEGEKLLQKGIIVNPQGYEAHYGLGRILLAQKQYPAAVTELKEVLGAEPNFADAHCALAQAYQQLGKRQDARVEFDGCAKLNGSRPKTESGTAGRNP